MTAKTAHKAIRYNLLMRRFSETTQKWIKSHDPACLTKLDEAAVGAYSRILTPTTSGIIILAFGSAHPIPIAAVEHAQSSSETSHAHLT